MQQDLASHANSFSHALARVGAWMLPFIVLATGLLMVSNIRYPHLVNRYLRGRRSITTLLVALIGGLLLVTVHRYTVGIASLGYVAWGLASSSYLRFRARPSPSPSPSTVRGAAAIVVIPTPNSSLESPPAEGVGR